jgi:hypothetical protein
VDTVHRFGDGLRTQDGGARHLEEDAEELSGILVVFHDQHTCTGQAREHGERLDEHNRGRASDGRTVDLHGYLRKAGEGVIALRRRSRERAEGVGARNETKLRPSFRG